MSISYPPCFKLANSRTKRGGIEEIAISHIFLTSLVWSIPPPPECWCWCPHIPFPLHQTFHPWSNKEAPENILRNAWSFLLTCPRGVLPVWCWASSRHFALFGPSSFSLTFWVGSSRVLLVHLVCLALAPEHKGAPITGVMRKSWFQWELVSVWSTGFLQGRKGCLQQLCVPLCTVPPPTGLSPFSSLCRHWL